MEVLKEKKIVKRKLDIFTSMKNMCGIWSKGRITDRQSCRLKILFTLKERIKGQKKSLRIVVGV